ncbi:hypothetical protein Taro_026901 [Colocasia esculenta]|uniref:Retrotransposon gag domain-containing protein n=1 Tax=Colocasia esculenta TaxID=4460 RepID=A0A843VGI3_COLES|nr:hypothetical protein [Colocasia esculenta]
MGNLDNLKTGQDMLLHQIEEYWEVMSDVVRELYHNPEGDQQPSVESTTRSTDPDEVENWIKDIERIFRAIRCSEEDKICLTTFQLDRDARAWWEAIESTLEDPDQIVLEEFVELFNEQYFSEVVQEKKATEFANIKQHGMTMFEYEAQFARLSKYASHLIAIEKLKVKRFMNGLRPNFITQLMPHLVTTYSKMVKRAFALEAANEIVERIKGKFGGSSSTTDHKRKLEMENAPNIPQSTRKLGKAPVGNKYQTLGDEFTSCWGRVEEFLAAGEQEIVHTKPFFFPVASAVTCTDSDYEVQEEEQVEDGNAPE